MRILIAEGNIQSSRQRSKEIGGLTPGEGYAEVVRTIWPSIQIDLYNLPDTDAELPHPLHHYDGIIVTGSSLNIYEDRPEVHRQIAFAKDIFRSGLPFFGSCWGLQIATVAAGGEVQRNERGREIGFARNVRLTEAGVSHPMHFGRYDLFDAPAVHTDHITRPAVGTTVTASNTYSQIQAAEIRHDNGTFWGVQYHPEFSLRDIADVLVRYGQMLVDEEHLFDSVDAMYVYTENLHLLHRDPTRRDIAWQYAIGGDLLKDDVRLLEIANWLHHQVGVENAIAMRGLLERAARPRSEPDSARCIPADSLLA
jgi:GMP synthase (glutamine-hydrolysing)